MTTTPTTKSPSRKWSVTALAESRANETRIISGTVAYMQQVVADFYAVGVAVPVGPHTVEYQRPRTVTVTELQD